MTEKRNKFIKILLRVNLSYQNKSSPCFKLDTILHHCSTLSLYLQKITISKERQNFRTDSEHFNPKIGEKLRTASLKFKFTGSYKKRVITKVTLLVILTNSNLIVIFTKFTLIPTDTKLSKVHDVRTSLSR